MHWKVFANATGLAVLQKLKQCVSIYNLNVIIGRGRHAAMCKGADTQLRGASRIVCVSLVCHRRQLPSGYSPRQCHRVAARQLHPPQQLLHQGGWQSFQGFYTQLQPFQGLPHLQHPGSSCWRSWDQSRMWVKFHFTYLRLTFLCKVGFQLVLQQILSSDHNSDKSPQKSMTNKALLL